jgi:hypothetical protein
MTTRKRTGRARLVLIALALTGALGTWWTTSRAEAGCYRYACMSMADGSTGYCLRCFGGGTP